MQASERLYLYSYYNNELVRFRDAPILGGQTNLPAYTQYYLFDFLLEIKISILINSTAAFYHDKFDS